MNWPPTLADELPAPRDDEPSSLRQDIVDELADHLNCSFNRELHQTRDEAAARNNALDRFGDPRQIARKLWFDALKEKIMTQRLSLVLSAVMAVACMAATGLGWYAFREGREVNAAILERLEALTSRPVETPAPNVSEWIPVKARLVLDTPDGPTAVGYNARLEGNVYGGASASSGLSQGTIDEVCGSSGEIDFGLLSVGRYFLRVTTPWGESSQREVGIRPGNTPNLMVVCPSRRPETSEVQVSVDWPDDLKVRPLYAFVRLGQHTRNISGTTWSPPYPDPKPFVVRQCECPLDECQILAFNPNVIAELSNTALTHPFVFPTTLKFAGSQQRTEGDYALNQLMVLMAGNGESHDAPRSFHVLGSFANSGSGGMGGGGGFGSGGGGGFFQVVDEQDDASENLQPETPAQPPLVIDGANVSNLKVRPGKPNHWRITLPEELVQQVRDSLKVLYAH